MHELGLIRLLLARLERISADSFWAHHASGLRGALLRMQGKLEEAGCVQEPELNRLLKRGFEILKRAAEEKS